ncbi:EF-hand domain-containing protein [Akkermansiaceae bacterium]|nr:EF-hand domain-containing protein [Akkermansiaceae bacterium]
MKLKKIAIITALAGSVSLAQAGDKRVGDGTLPEFLQQFDTNEDGMIDEEERQAIKELREERRKERRDAIDTNDDGEISEEEKEAARAAIRERIEARRAEHFARIAGEDGLLSKEEFEAIPALADTPQEIIDAMFARLDADGSGDVTLEEFMDRLRRHRDGPRPDPRPRPEGA